MFDVRKFRIYVVNTKVWKGYDYVILPDGRRVSVPPGKYMRIGKTADGKMAFAFEDLTEEIGEKPDYDFNEPYCVVEEVSQAIIKKVRLSCQYEGGYENHLYYGNVKVFEFKGGSYSKEITFSYCDRDEGILASVTAGAGIGATTYLVSKNAQAGLGLGIATAVAGAVLSFLQGQ
jgi:hypothetical protein